MDAGINWDRGEERTPGVPIENGPGSIQTNRDGSMTSESLVRILQDIQLQPDWRTLPDKCADYYDNNQLTAQALAEIEAKGLPPIIVNLVKPTIDIVLGMEEKTRTDWRVSVEQGESEEVDDLAEGLSAKLHEVEKKTRADRACSEAYAAQVKTGLGWIEVARENNPFKYPYRVKYVHRREIDWDWRAREFDLSDARFLIRRKWYDNDVLCAMFPGQRDKIRAVTGGWNLWDNTTFGAANTGLYQDLADESRFSMEESEWRDMGRLRTCLFEVWYRVYQPATILRAGNRIVVMDETNPMHVNAVEANLVDVSSAIIDRVRQAYFIGPHRLADRPSPYSHNKFPYVPFFGFREDITGNPYGLIRSMLSSQDEVNARRAKMYWLLSTRRVVADEDVVVDHGVAAREVARPDSYVILSKDRKDRSEFRVEENGTIAKDQFTVMADAADNIQKTGGVYQAMLGDNPKAQSGLAINSMIEQGSTSLGELNGNYRDARMEVGNLLLELLKEDIGQNQISVPVGEGMQRKAVILNQPSGVEVGGYPVLKNDVQRSVSQVTLDSVPSTATFRQQLSSQLIEMTKALPPQIQGLVIDFVIESSDLPKRHEIADRIRKALGIKPAGQEGVDVSPEVQQAQQAIEQIKAEAQQAIAQLQGELQKTQEALDQQKRQNLEYKREIAAIGLEDRHQQFLDNQADREAKTAERVLHKQEADAMVAAKLEMLADAVGRLSQIVSASRPQEGA